MTAPTGAQENVLEKIEDEIGALVERARPSVVSIYAKSLRQTSWFSRFKRRISMGDGAYWQRNVGSGVGLDSEGHILTTESVVLGARDIRVKLASGEDFPAWLVGTDEGSRIAVIKIEGGKVQSASLGNSDQLKAGHWAIILGNSFGTSSTSLGLISGWREGSKLIQITARVCPGNSGAPVFDSSGKVIGIVIAAIAGPVSLSSDFEQWVSDGAVRITWVDASAISLAVPINEAQRAAWRLIQEGETECGWLGVTLRQGDGVPAWGEESVRIFDVVRGGPAEKAGLKGGDVILEYDEQEANGAYQLVKMVKNTPVGKRVKVKLRRGGEEFWVEVRIGRRQRR